MTADALKKITTDALDTLAALLDEGHSDQLTALLKTMARFHKYSWHNVCLIASQRPTATRVAGFQTWRTMGRFVRKGEKGIAILAPIVGRREAESAGDNARTVVGFRAAYVFDVEQTDGEPLAGSRAKPPVIPAPRRPRSRPRFSSEGIALESVDDLGGALGHVKRRTHSAPQRSLARDGVHDARPRIRARTAASRRRPTGLT